MHISIEQLTAYRGQGSKMCPLKFPPTGVHLMGNPFALCVDPVNTTGYYFSALLLIRWFEYFKRKIILSGRHLIRGPFKRRQSVIKMCSCWPRAMQIAKLWTTIRTMWHGTVVASSYWEMSQAGSQQESKHSGHTDSRKWICPQPEFERGSWTSDERFTAPADFPLVRAEQRT